MKLIKLTTVLLVCATFAGPAGAELRWRFKQHTGYMALGDTLFSNVGVPGATSPDVLTYQVPLAVQAFKPQAVMLTVGGNDLLKILNGADPYAVLSNFGSNLWQSLGALCEGLPGAAVYVSNLYTVPLPGVDLVDVVVPLFNDAVARIVAGAAVDCDVRLVDIYGAFQGRDGLLLIDRTQSNLFEVHPANAGYREMARACMEVIWAN